MGDMICNNRRETHLNTSAKAIDFGANLRANFGLSSFYQHQIKIPSLVLVIAAKHRLESLQRLRSHFSTACTATSIRFATDARNTFVIFCHNN
jgi:hypothetical protein